MMTHLAYSHQTFPATAGGVLTLVKNRDDKPIPNLANCCLLTSQTFPDTFRLNTFTGRTEVHHPLPSPVTGKPMAQDGARELTDSDYTAVSSALARSHGLSFSVQLVSAAVQSVAEENEYHPIRDYLGSLKWDGVPRLEHWLHDYLGAEDSEYTAGVGRMFLISMVARVMEPGCKADYMMVLEGPQGIRKSSACRVLAGGRYFSDNLPPIRDSSKDLSQHLAGKWLIELAELSATSRADTEALKAFLTRTEETYRPAYGRNEVRQPRQCIFIGTTNRSEYLRDATGDRRFWPVLCGLNGEPVDIEGLQAARDQLFAEAFHLYQHGYQKWWPDSDFESEYIRPEQAKRYDDHPWLGTLETHFRTHPEMKEVTVSGLLNVPIGKTAAGRADKATVKDCLQKLGWVHRRTGQQSDRWVLEN